MKNLLLIVFSVSVLVLSTSSILSSGGKAGATGSPGETTSCTQCHTDTLNSGPGSVTIVTNIPSNIYALGTTYQVSVTVAQTGAPLFAFDTECLLNSDNTDAGTFVITNATETKILVGNSRNNVVNKANAGLVANTKTFNFDWTAPITDLGAVTFYAAGMASNNSGGMTGDNIYTTSLLINSPNSAGINDVSNANYTNVYYNSANSSIHLSLNITGNNKVKGSLYNLTGQKTSELFNETMGGKVEKDIPVSSKLAKGIYFVRLQQNDNSITKKIIIE